MLQLIFSTFFPHSRDDLGTMFPLLLFMRCNDRHMYANTFFHSQTINHYITYSVISSEPALTYTSVVSTIRCYAITSGDLEGSTYVEYTGNFSSDADAGNYHLSPHSRRVLQDHANVLRQPSSKMPNSSAATLWLTWPRSPPRTKILNQH